MIRAISAQDVDRIIVKGDAKTLVSEAERFGKELAENKLTKSQIRSAFGAVRQIDAAWVKDASSEQSQQMLRDVLLMKPRLAYQAKRDRSGTVKPLADVLSMAIDKIADVDDHAVRTLRFKCFVDLFEAILAYHTAYEKKESSHD